MNYLDFSPYFSALWNVIALKHMAGRHNQKRHGWRYGREPTRQFLRQTLQQALRRGQSEEEARRIVAARHSMRLTPQGTERAEYRRRSDLPHDVVRISRRPTSESPAKPESAKPESISSSPKSAEELEAYLKSKNIATNHVEKMWKAAQDTGVDVVSFIESFNYESQSSDLKSVVTAVSGRSVFGKILDKNGEKVGGFSRTLLMLDGVKTVYHESLGIKPAYQGSGFGSEFYRHSEQEYIRQGIQRIALMANISVGGYAWARMGFDFSDNLIRKQFISQAKRTYRRLTGESYKGELKHAWDIAALRTPSGENVGKMVLLGQSWSGYKDLADNSPGFHVGQLYYEAKGKK